MLSPALSAPARRRPTVSSLQHPLEHVLLGAVPLLVAALAFYDAHAGGYVAGDFRHAFLVAAWRELHGADPYQWTRLQIVHNISFPYPALTAILLEPFALLSGGLAAALYLALCLGAIAGALYVLGVRDWRVYGISLLWSPVLIALQTANFTLPLVFGVAAAWRWRDRAWAAGLVTALLISIKPVMFPVAIWLLVTRRYRAAGYAVLIGALLNAVAWTLIGWNELGRWLHLVAAQSSDLYRTGYSVLALVAHLGAGRSVGAAAAILVSVAVVAACVHLGRTGHDAHAFVLAVGLCLVASPHID